jgi:uncharacterized membrane protein YeaQ/YmgE (transglycosylase-associated protein family)
MPSMGGALAALLAGWMIDGMCQPILGVGVTLVLSFVGSTVAFFVVQRWLKSLRDG